MLGKYYLGAFIVSFLQVLINKWGHLRMTPKPICVYNEVINNNIFFSYLFQLMLWGVIRTLMQHRLQSVKKAKDFGPASQNTTTVSQHYFKIGQFSIQYGGTMDRRNDRFAVWWPNVYFDRRNKHWTINWWDIHFSNPSSPCIILKIVGFIV